MDTPTEPPAPEPWPLLGHPAGPGEAASPDPVADGAAPDPTASDEPDRRPGTRAGSGLPVVPGALRASDSDRAQVATVLSTAYAEGRLTHEEHDERLDQAMRARTFDELVPLTEDLVPLDVPLQRSSPGGSPAGGPEVDRHASSEETDRFVAVLGAFERKGHWRVRPHNQALTVLGGGSLDLTEAVWESDQIVLTALTVLGSIDITVPEGVTVRNETMAVLGDTGTELPTAPDGSPTLVLKGLCLLGSVSVTTGRASRHGSGKHRSDQHRSDRHRSDRHRSDKHRSDKHRSTRHGGRQR